MSSTFVLVGRKALSSVTGLMADRV